MNDDNESELKTDSFFERFVHDDEFRQLLDVRYKVPDNSDSDSDKKKGVNKMEIKNINIDELTLDINGKTKKITYEVLSELNAFDQDLVYVESADCEGTVQKWVFKSVPGRYVVVLADNSLISDKDNECHDKLDPSSSFNF